MRTLQFSGVRLICPDEFGNTGLSKIPVPARSGDCLGVSMAASPDGRLLILGAPRHQGADGKVPGGGAVFVFSSDSGKAQDLRLRWAIGSGHASQAFIDTGLEGQQNLFFGHAISVDPSGTFFAVSAHGDRGSDGKGRGRGAVYIFEITPNQSGLRLHSRIGGGYSGPNDVAVHLENYHYFGSSIDIDSRRGLVIVGAHHGNGAAHQINRSGQIHIFRFSESGFRGGQPWAGIGADYKELPSYNLDLKENEYFGQSVALHPSLPIVAVGAYGDRGVAGTRKLAGAIYLFYIGDGEEDIVLRQSIRDPWAEEHQLPLHDETRLGMSATFDPTGDFLLVSAAGVKRSQSPDGGIWVFRCVNGQLNGVERRFNVDDINTIIGEQLVKDASWWKIPCVIGGSKWMAFGIDFDVKDMNEQFRTETAFVVVADVLRADLDKEDAGRLEVLEEENARLKRLVAEQALDTRP